MVDGGNSAVNGSAESVRDGGGELSVSLVQVFHHRVNNKLTNTSVSVRMQRNSDEVGRDETERAWRQCLETIHGHLLYGGRRDETVVGKHAEAIPRRDAAFELRGWLSVGAMACAETVEMTLTRTLRIHGLRHDANTLCRLSCIAPVHSQQQRHEERRASHKRLSVASQQIGFELGERSCAETILCASHRVSQLMHRQLPRRANVERRAEAEEWESEGHGGHGDAGWLSAP
mmetsp:Transcript_25112/g.54424  ORF Transcript_25112/g.54424 Transcript_25112/m.54424 type:complete len:231 (+) Transcript_25112:1239-1931(+)